MAFKSEESDSSDFNYIYSTMKKKSLVFKTLIRVNDEPIMLPYSSPSTTATEWTTSWSSQPASLMHSVLIKSTPNFIVIRVDRTINPDAVQVILRELSLLRKQAASQQVTLDLIVNNSGPTNLEQAINLLSRIAFKPFEDEFQF